MLKESSNITEAIIQLIKSLPETQQEKIVKTVSKKKKAARAKNEQAWRDSSARNFLKGYGTNEPDYTKADIKEPNPEYKKWKKGK